MQTLSNEDNLRLNVLLSQNVQAIRIDEGKMIVYGLTDRGEAKIKLNPNVRDEKYIRSIKETISSHVLGSPGGYPVYIKRWTRMGQARDQSLESLLKLGEPEAIVAVIHAQGLTDEMARRAWWAMPSAENARRMLEKEAVAEGNMGRVLAEFLLEFLPYEEQARDIIESVRLVLQPGLISEEERQSLWDKGQRKNVFRVGFLLAQPDAIPEQQHAHALFNECQITLQQPLAQGNVYARQLQRIYSEQGQSFLHTVESIIGKPSNQDVVVMTLEAIRYYLHDIRLVGAGRREMDAIEQEVEQVFSTASDSMPEGLSELLAHQPEYENALKALIKLASVGVDVVNPIFAQTDAIGTVMRRKLEPVSRPLLQYCAELRGRA